MPSAAEEPLSHVHQPETRQAAPATTSRLALWGLEELQSSAAAAYNTQLGRAGRALRTPGGVIHLHRCLQRLEFAAAHPALLERSLARVPLCQGTLTAVAASGSPHLRRARQELARLREEGHRLVVLCSPYTSVLHAAAAFLAPQATEPFFFYTGAMSAEEREASLRGFLGAQSAAVLFLSQKAGGQGLSLVPATAILFLNLWFTHASHDQAVARLARTGQPCPVQVAYVGARAGLLPAILALQSKDRQSAEALLKGQEPPRRREGCCLLDTCAWAPLALSEDAHGGEAEEDGRRHAGDDEGPAELHAVGQKYTRSREPQQEEAR